MQSYHFSPRSSREASSASLNLKRLFGRSQSRALAKKPSCPIQHLGQKAQPTFRNHSLSSARSLSRGRPAPHSLVSERNKEASHWRRRSSPKLAQTKRTVPPTCHSSQSPPLRHFFAGFSSFISQRALNPLPCCLFFFTRCNHKRRISDRAVGSRLLHQSYLSGWCSHPP